MRCPPLPCGSSPTPFRPARTINARLTVVHRQECDLCDEMLEELQALGRTMELPPIDIVDVDSDPVLQRRHGLDVPVLLLDGTVVCRHRLDVPELKRLLR
ncbi:MAG TPA: glutaredoxin family protein [Steroidobacteraceae bacterium]|nr:glutaredoxin family protein [Steroidobacteraceae bacterium]